MLNKNNYKACMPVVLLALVSGCSSPVMTQYAELGDKVTDSIGCTDFRSQIFDAYYNFLEQTQSRPDLKLVQKLVSKSIPQRLSSQGVATQNVDALLGDVKLLVEAIDQTLNLSEGVSSREMIQQLIKLESGSIETSGLTTMGSQLNAGFAKISQSLKGYSIACEKGPDLNPPENSVGSIPLLAIGARKVFATAYQTCDSLTLPDMTLAIQDVRGIEKDQSIDGVGWGRKYSSISLIQKTHYYIHGVNYKLNCHSVKDKPLVYDYGGAPSITREKTLNLFADTGTGGSALGIDCSAFVSSAIAHAGLKYSPELSNKPIYSRRSSSDFLKPEANGLKCFQRIPVSPQQTIRVGDIMAVQGHVVIIDHVGADPFGVEKVRSTEGCNSMNLKNFDFTIIQSSPSKESIGLNRYIARDYLSEAPEKMRDGFMQYAMTACLSHFDEKSRTLKSNDVSIIRHLGTSQCLSGKVGLVGQECVQDCPLKRQDD